MARLRDSGRTSLSAPQQPWNPQPESSARNPYHAAESIPGLTFWSVRDRPLREIWECSPAFAAFRGTDWMWEPCISCPRKTVDFGGCRCQAFALTGDARNADPA